MSDQFASFQARLSGEPVEIHENRPQAGAYRRKDKNRRWEAVFIWQEGGVWKTLITPAEGEAYNVSEAKDGFTAVCKVWASCCRNLVTFAVYKAVTEKREPWPTEIEERPATNEAAFSELERIQSEIDELIRDAAKIKDDELLAGFDPAAYAARLAAKGKPDDLVPNLTKLSNIATKLVELKNQADKLRAAEKQPHLEAGKAVDEKWSAPKGKADNAAKDIKARAGTAMVEIKARLQALNPPDPEGKPAGDVNVSLGTRGKKVALKTVREVVLTDYEAALTHALTSPQFRKLEMLQRLVKGAAEFELFNGRDFPGAKIETREVAA